MFRAARMLLHDRNSNYSQLAKGTLESYRVDTMQSALAAV